jgi:microcystin-dependent protein
MPVLQTGQSFASGNQVTATKLQDIANLATFRTGANNTADGSTIEVDATGGYLKVPSNGIGTNQLSSDASVDANRAVGTNHIKDGAVTAAKLDSAAVSVLMPTATVLPYAGSTAPFGYLVCAGQSVLVADYGGLHGIIGYTYGGSGASFNLPDLRGRVIAGLDSDSGGFADRLTTGSAANLNGRLLGGNNGDPGDTGRGTNGAQEHLLTAAQSGLPSHSHTIPIQQSAGGNTPRDGGTGTFTETRTTGTTGGTSASSAHNNVQPTIILNYIIKT